jgi:Na+/melibiose symporter-like transporter
MLLLMLLPMAVGFVLLFVPNKLSAAGKFITLVISAVALYFAIGIVTSPPQACSANIFKVDNFELSLDLTATKLGSYILVAACGFGLLITL